MADVTLWAVWAITWEDQSVLSIWSTRELADMELARIRALDHEWYGAEFDIQEHVLDLPWSPP